MNPRDLPIGVLGSGLGGLSVVRALRRILPFETFLYLGDTAQGSYGNKSAETIARLTLHAGTALARHQPKLLVIASGTASAFGLAALQAAAPCPVLGAIEPGAQAAAAAGGPVGIIGTAATIRSGAFEAAILRRSPGTILYPLACPLLADLAEEGWIDDPITDAICRRYLNQIPFEAHTVLLGCTAHATLLPSLTRVRPGTKWLDCGELTALAAEDMLRSGLGFRTASAQGQLRILLTEDSPRVRESGARFLGEALEAVEQVG
jgi:glutamate racemase